MSNVISEGNGNADTSPPIANASREAIIAFLGKREKPIFSSYNCYSSDIDRSPE